MINNIKKIRDEAGITQQEMSELLDVPVMQIYRLESAKKDIKGSWLWKLSLVLNAWPESLVDFSDDSDVNRFKDGKLDAPSITKVPILEWADVDSDKRPLGGEHFMSAETISPKGFALKIQNNKLEPRFLAGDLITVDPDSPIDEGCYCLVSIEGDEPRLLLLKEMGESHYHFTSGLPRSAVFVVDKESETSKIYGKVISINVRL